MGERVKREVQEMMVVDKTQGHLVNWSEVEECVEVMQTDWKQLCIFYCVEGM